jgi:phage tail-like protein
MATGQRVDPYNNFNFLVEIDGITRAAFQEASGFDSAIDVVEHREGGENTTVRKLPGMTKYSNITLKWGATDDRDLYDWHRQWVTGDPAAARKNGSVILPSIAGQEKVRWNFVNAARKVTAQLQRRRQRRINRNVGLAHRASSEPEAPRRRRTTMPQTEYEFTLPLATSTMRGTFTAWCDAAGDRRR